MSVEKSRSLFVLVVWVGKFTPSVANAIDSNVVDLNSLKSHNPKNSSGKSFESIFAGSPVTPFKDITVKSLLNLQKSISTVLIGKNSQN